MRQFTMSLIKESQRPVIVLHNWKSMRALLDTGAQFPIWTDSEELLIRCGGKIIKRNVEFGGFGGKAKGNLYRLDALVLGDLVFPKMNIIACSDMGNVPFQLILSATMFQKLIYEIDDKNHKLNVTIPDNESFVRNLIINDSSGKISVFCSSGDTAEI